MIHCSKKVPALMAAMLSASLLLAPVTYAEYPVHDSQANETLQKILKETEDINKESQKIADNTEKSKNAQEKDVAAWGTSTLGKIDKIIQQVQDTLKDFKNSYENFSKGVDDILWTVNDGLGSIVFGQGAKDADGKPLGGGMVIKTPNCWGTGGQEVVISTPEQTHDILTSCIPPLGEIGADGKPIPFRTKADGSADFSLSARQAAILSAVGYLMKQNEHTLNIYNKLNGYLLGYEKQLDKLLEMNAAIGQQGMSGSVAAQQVANDIAYVRGKMEHIRAAMNALDGQQTILNQQIEAQKQVNDDLVRRGQEEATSQSKYTAADRGRASMAAYKAKYGSALAQ